MKQNAIHLPQYLTSDSPPRPQQYNVGCTLGRRLEFLFGGQAAAMINIVFWGKGVQILKLVLRGVDGFGLLRKDVLHTVAALTARPQPASRDAMASRASRGNTWARRSRGAIHSTKHCKPLVSRADSSTNRRLRLLAAPQLEIL